MKSLGHLFANSKSLNEQEVLRTMHLSSLDPLHHILTYSGKVNEFAGRKYIVKISRTVPGKFETEGIPIFRAYPESESESQVPTEIRQEISDFIKVRFGKNKEVIYQR